MHSRPSPTHITVAGVPLYQLSTSHWRSLRLSNWPYYDTKFDGCIKVIRQATPSVLCGRIVLDWVIPGFSKDLRRLFSWPHRKFLCLWVKVGNPIKMDNVTILRLVDEGINIRILKDFDNADYLQKPFVKQILQRGRKLWKGECVTADEDQEEYSTGDRAGYLFSFSDFISYIVYRRWLGAVGFLIKIWGNGLHGIAGGCVHAGVEKTWRKRQKNYTSPVFTFSNRSHRIPRYVGGSDSSDYSKECLTFNINTGNGDICPVVDAMFQRVLSKVIERSFPQWSFGILLHPPPSLTKESDPAIK